MGLFFITDLGPLIPVKSTLYIVEHKNISDDLTFPTLWEKFGKATPFLFQPDSTGVPKVCFIKTNRVLRGWTSPNQIPDLSVTERSLIIEAKVFYQNIRVLTHIFYKIPSFQIS